MRRSRKFRELSSRISRLRNHLLPKAFHPMGLYTERQIDRARAFRLLAHAEIESYLEDIAFDTANKAYDIWQQRGLSTQPLIALVAFSEANSRDLTGKISLNNYDDLEGRIKRSINSFNSYTKGRNNGIKEADLLRLLLPIGITESDIDPVWLSTTNSFGGSRGETAHGSWRVTNPPDPQNEFNTVKQILQGLSDIDLKLLAFRSV